MARNGGLIGPIGTTVTIKAGGRAQWRDVASGDSFLSTHDPRPHFGLGTGEIVDEVDVQVARRHPHGEAPGEGPADAPRPQGELSWKTSHDWHSSKL